MSQALALFVKAVHKISKRLHEIQKLAITAELSLPNQATQGLLESESRVERRASDSEERPSSTINKGNVNEDQDTSGESQALREKQREMIQSLDLSK